jgi:glycosyltransferase involved in cell wall biosynthesis
MFDEVLFADDQKYQQPEEIGAECARLADGYDIVHTSLLPLQWRWEFKRRMNAPCVETYHSLDGWNRIWRQYEIRLQERVEKLPEATVAVSNGLAKAIQKAGISARTIYNGVKLPSAPPDEPGDYVTYCGRIAHDKGLEDWLKIAQRIRQRMPRAKFQWVGALSPQYDATAFRWLQVAAPWLEVTGFVEDPSPYYRRSSVQLLTSPSEGLPMVILEAAGHGVPTVAYDVGDIKETPATLVYNPAEAEEATVHWMTCGCRQKRRNLYDTAHAQFSTKGMADAYLEVYECLL